MDPATHPFDLETYAARYDGRGKIHRLRHIASVSPPHRREALTLAITESLHGRDTSLYKTLHHDYTSHPTHPPLPLETTWLSTTDRWAARELEKLRHELEDSKQQANKEVIRTGHTDLGDFFHARGRLVQARGDYAKTRDYCMVAAHTLQMCARVIVVSIEAGEFAHVENHFLMAENLPQADPASPQLSKMRACAGLALLVRGNFAAAAPRFVETNACAEEEGVAGLATAFRDVVSLEDVATYGALTALATMQRAAVAKLIVPKAAFRNLLELVPGVREAVCDFYHSRYARCLEGLEGMRAELELDVFVGPHVPALYALIRRKALVQYVSPYAAADLGRMAGVFGVGRGELEEEVLGLIEGGLVRARLDMEKGALVGVRCDARLDALAGAVKKGREAFEEMEAMLLRMALVKGGVDVLGGSLSRAASDMGPRGRSAHSVAEIPFDHISARQP